MNQPRAWLLWLAVALSAVACPTPRLEPAPLDRVELATGDAPDATALPLIVLLHGRGGDAERFAKPFRALPFAAHVISLSAPIQENAGRAWFVFDRGLARALDQLHALVPRVLVTVRAYTLGHSVAGRPLLSGFSQGGMLCYELALRAPRAFAAVFPVSAMLLDDSFDRLPAELPPIHAFHGGVDPVIPFDSSASSIARLRRMGAAAELTRIDAAPHWITADMQRALFGALELAARAQTTRR